MKKVQFKTFRNWKFPILIATLFAGTLYLSSCNKSDSNGPVPTLTLTSDAGSNAPGLKVSTSVHIDAPEGGKTLTIQVNGVSSTDLPNVDLGGEKSKDVSIEYTIPSSAGIGSTINITFQASDKKNQLSTVSTFVITVSAVPLKQIQEVTGNITTDTHWTADKIYRLNGFVRVGRDEKATNAPGIAPSILATATLTIDPGTVILGKVGTPGGTLVIQRGSKIIANGTAAKPIVFTSDRPIGSRKSGDWGGLVICGKSLNNIMASASTGQNGVEELEGGYGGFHGGTVSDDNSGSLQYVRVEYAGYPINPNQEINGITFGSVGSGTTVDHVQVTYANDDSYEWFGGTVVAKHLIAYKGIDDDFDTDNGFSGKVQFGLGIRDAGIADQSGSNGFECDNDAAGSANTPVTAAQFSNMTIIGGKATSGTTINLQFQNVAQIRRNAQQDIINSFFTAYPNGIFIDNALGTPGTIANATSGSLIIKNNILAGVEGWGGNGFGSAATADEITALSLSGAGSNHPNNPRGRVVAGGAGSFTNGVFAYSGSELQISSQAPIAWFAASNTVKSKWTDVGISANIFEPIVATPTLLPTASSLLATKVADFTGFSGFESVSYVGAFGSTDWTTDGGVWVNWNPSITDYSK